MKTKYTSKYLRYALMAIAACLFCVFSALFSLDNKWVYAEEANDYQTIHVGDVIEAEDYTFSSQNGVKAEGVTVVYPNGSVYGGEKFEVEKAGKYQVTYYATVGGARVEETLQYMAIRKPQNLIVAEEGMSVTYGKYQVTSDKYKIQKETYGTLVTFKSGQSITFAANIKTEKLTADYNILDLIVMPSVFKETDFERLTVRLTDSKDADNYVEVVIDSSNAVDGGGQVSYVRAGANGQQLGGFEGKTFHTSNYGAQIEHSFRAFGYADNVYIEGEDPRLNEKNHKISENSLTVSMDHESKKIFCSPATVKGNDQLMVNDLDDPTHYKGNPWGGFTSDEITVTVTAGRFAKMEGMVLIKSYGDYDLSKDVVDTNAPEIVVECDETQKMPVAVVGEKFPIFPYIIKDALDKNVNSNVWVYYNDAQGNQITVANDGEGFVPNYAGNYEIIYYAEDYSGNFTSETIAVEAVEKTPNIFIAIDNPVIETEVYQTVTIPTAEQMQAFGGSGALTIERAVYSPSNYLLNVKDKLYLTELGDYKIVYTATDYLGNVEHGILTVRGLELPAPTFVETPIMDDYLIAGFEYEFPKAFAVETVNGELVELSYKTYVNGELKNGSFKAQGTEMHIRYVAEGKNGAQAIWDKYVTVSETEKGKYKSNYFYRSNGVQIVDEKSYVELTFGEDSEVGFINALYTQGFSLSMSYEGEKIGFGSMAITFTDAGNRSKAVTIHLSYDAATDKWFVQLNGSDSKISYATSKDILTCMLSGDNANKIIDASGVSVATIVSYDNGEKFEGFSDTLYLHIQFKDVVRESSIRITQICNQSMGYVKSSLDKASDTTKPIIILNEELPLRQKLGTKAIIPTAKAFDVLGQIRQFTITVEFGGQEIASGDATQPLKFLLDKAGYYNVLYYAKDSNGNTEKIPYLIYVKDETAPTLTVDNSLNKEYKVGDKITVPMYSAKDNGENCYVQVTLILPNNEMRLLQYSENGQVTSLLDKENEIYDNSFKADKNAFVAQKSGLYVLRVVAYDEYYNYSVVEMQFTVK